MTLGEKLKQLRNDRSLSQPELAEKIGIEQSYLSKLENDKSMPSNDIFKRLLAALEINTSQFISQFDAHYIRTTLSQIPDIENYIEVEREKRQSSSRKLLIGSSLAIVLATTLFYTGITAILFSDTLYQYESSGVTVEGEPADLFEGGLQRMELDGPEFRKQKALLGKRRDPHVMHTMLNKGSEFTLSVDGGRRQYYLQNDTTIERPENSVLQILGILFFTAGIMGFVYELRISRYRQ
ncbi:helix-turn-helix domain-containing protein [Alteromonadaceae bacterium M269]|nr:helix-turn-helix domain-containing protein [Alteromonadaceae bacterium M269]